MFSYEGPNYKQSVNTHLYQCLFANIRIFHTWQTLKRGYFVLHLHNTLFVFLQIMDNYIVSARKYRPSSFDTVVGQRSLTTTLKNAIANNKLAHAYLFCGPRGVGKTTCARIFAKTINCLNPLAEGEACNECESCKAFNEQRSYNIHELDAASNNSVDDIRTLIEQVRIPPQIGKYKVYIIDEVHMLSTSAFNAFLKTLEEPPHHAIFILATTEKHKILPTILSRCQIYDFNRIGINETIEHLKYVATKEGVNFEPEALGVIAHKADGGMRDALSIFDQIVSFTNGNISYKNVIENLNVLDYDYYFRFVDIFLKNEVTSAMLLFNEIINKGFDGSHFINGLASHLRDLLVSKDSSTVELLEVSESIRNKYVEQASKCDTKFLYRTMKLCNNCDINYKTSKNKRLLVELTLIECAQATLPDEDGVSNGRRPTKSLKPIFKQADVKNNGQAQKVETVNNNQVNSVSTNSAVSANNSTQSTPPRTSPLPKIEESSNIPVVKESEIRFSLKRSRLKNNDTQSNESITNNVIAKEDYQDYIFNEKDLIFYWRDYASSLPDEEKANSARMMNITPKLLSDTLFEAVVDNEIVEKFMNELRPSIEKYLCEKLHNRNIKMKVRVSENNEIIRAYSHLERFQLMSKKNPSLLKMKEAFGLELS